MMYVTIKLNLSFVSFPSLVLPAEMGVS